MSHIYLFFKFFFALRVVGKSLWWCIIWLAHLWKLIIPTRHHLPSFLQKRAVSSIFILPGCQIMHRGIFCYHRNCNIVFRGGKKTSCVVFFLLHLVEGTDCQEGFWQNRFHRDTSTKHTMKDKLQSAADKALILRCRHLVSSQHAAASVCPSQEKETESFETKDRDFPKQWHQSSEPESSTVRTESSRKKGNLIETNN